MDDIYLYLLLPKTQVIRAVRNKVKMPSSGRTQEAQQNHPRERESAYRTRNRRLSKRDYKLNRQIA